MNILWNCSASLKSLWPHGRRGDQTANTVSFWPRFLLFKLWQKVKFTYNKRISHGQGKLGHFYHIVSAYSVQLELATYLHIGENLSFSKV